MSSRVDAVDANVVKRAAANMTRVPVANSSNGIHLTMFSRSNRRTRPSSPLISLIWRSRLIFLMNHFSGIRAMIAGKA